MQTDGKDRGRSAVLQQLLRQALPVNGLPVLPVDELSEGQAALLAPPDLLEPRLGLPADNLRRELRLGEKEG